MQDFLGQELVPGDYVVSAGSSWTGFKTGKIRNLAPKTVNVQWFTLRDKKKRDSVYPSQLIKIDADTAMAYNLRNEKPKF